ncbi:MAG: hypothetical protein LBO09_04765 [Candidatus Peribacteria bacterium]|nr:hypothetical protein [Candidatus Peribacteria bacterium]
METNEQVINRDILLSNVRTLRVVKPVMLSVIIGIILFLLMLFQGNVPLIIVSFFVLVIGFPFGIYKATKSFYKNWEPRKKDLERGIKAILEGDLCRDDYSLEDIYHDLGEYLEVLEEESENK